jgi:hypothetical protein
LEKTADGEVTAKLKNLRTREEQSLPPAEVASRLASNASR